MSSTDHTNTESAGLEELINSRSLRHTGKKADEKDEEQRRLDDKAIGVSDLYVLCSQTAAGAEFQQRVLGGRRFR